MAEGRWLVLFDHLIRALQERRGDREAERLGGLEIDDQLELLRLFDWKVGGLGALEDLVNVGGGAAEQLKQDDRVRYETASDHVTLESVHCGQTALRRELCQPTC